MKKGNFVWGLAQNKREEIKYEKSEDLGGITNLEDALFGYQKWS